MRLLNKEFYNLYRILVNRIIYFKGDIQMKSSTTTMWLSIAMLGFVISIGILLKVMDVPPYGTEFLKNIFSINQ